jgi:aryl-alcohol dehydrogenase-like predicted oxidoreductase
MIRREVQSRRWWKGCRQQGSRSPHRASSTFIGLQIEYSLLERTIEQELVPMALELGLGITPWSPLKSGALSGKYTRKNAGEAKGDRGFMDSFLNEKAFTVVDALDGTAHAHDSSVARVALSWVPAQRTCPRVDAVHARASVVNRGEDRLHVLREPKRGLSSAHRDRRAPRVSASHRSTRRCPRAGSTAARR